MITQLTVWDAQTRVSQDVEVSASPDTSVGSLLQSLPVHLGGRRCFVGATELDPRARFADSPLLSGAVISVGAPGPDFHPVLGASVGQLEVVAGADAGLAVALNPGRCPVARDSQAAMSLRDTDVNRIDPAFAETALLATLRSIITAGAPRGVHVVPLGGQDMLNGKLPALYTQRLLLPFPNEQTRRVHLTSRMVSPPAVPGRAIDAGSGRHVQICQPSVLRADLAASVAADGLDPARLPVMFPALPAHVARRDLPRPRSLPSPAWIPLGLGGPANTTISLDLFDAGPHLLLVSGPAESGCSTAALARPGRSPGQDRRDSGGAAAIPAGPGVPRRLADVGSILLGRAMATGSAKSCRGSLNLCRSRVPGRRARRGPA